MAEVVREALALPVSDRSLPASETTTLVPDLLTSNANAGVTPTVCDVSASSSASLSEREVDANAPSSAVQHLQDDFYAPVADVDVDDAGWSPDTHAAPSLIGAHRSGTSTKRPRNAQLAAVSTDGITSVTNFPTALRSSEHQCNAKRIRSLHAVLSPIHAANPATSADLLQRHNSLFHTPHLPAIEPTCAMEVPSDAEMERLVKLSYKATMELQQRQVDAGTPVISALGLLASQHADSRFAIVCVGPKQQATVQSEPIEVWVVDALRLRERSLYFNMLSNVSVPYTRLDQSLQLWPSCEASLCMDDVRLMLEWASLGCKDPLAASDDLHDKVASALLLTFCRNGFVTQLRDLSGHGPVLNPTNRVLELTHVPVDASVTFADFAELLAALATLWRSLHPSPSGCLCSSVQWPLDGGGVSVIHRPAGVRRMFCLESHRVAERRVLSDNGALWTNLSRTAHSFDSILSELARCSTVCCHVSKAGCDDVGCCHELQRTAASRRPCVTTMANAGDRDHVSHMTTLDGTDLVGMACPHGKLVAHRAFSTNAT